jgi:hypothetical protein
MVNLASWLKTNNFQADQVQTFYPSPMATATTMYHTGRNPLQGLSYKSEKINTVKSLQQRQLHKALLRYHDPKNWKIIKDLLLKMGKKNLIGEGPNCLIPSTPNFGKNGSRSNAKKFVTKHTSQGYKPLKGKRSAVKK